ncbi:MAG: hypothetical protein JWQ34_481 [Mucilaginibacter sp.]|uniref:DUF4271 domain-containing protein n=1 Tax=Mucilaginibacter sp. TaxID=1882438 RepID=UPI00262BE236|nr:DUF4271 domain-containing protein [Mucilaginibacter sp.]MDB5002256.1 hypothetical protein [Mucilaginibacter sp.]
MRFIVWCFLLMVVGCFAGYAQVDTTVRGHTVITPAQSGGMQVLDSVIMATAARKKFVEDSIAFQYIKYPDSTLSAQAARQYLREHLYHGNGFLDIPYKAKSTLRTGHTRQTRDQWIIIIIIGLLLYTAILNIALNKDIKNVFLSFYSKRALVQASKDDTQINFWAFVGLFLLFGLTFGLFLYQLASYKGIYYSISGFRLFISLMLIILLLFAVKFLVLKFVGFVFDIQKLVTEYVSILYLTYFNIAFVFLPVTVCFSLLAAVFIKPLLIVALILIVIIFTWLYLRSSVNIISNFRFHKFYLFVYLCALEICPILILIKALNI